MFFDVANMFGRRKASQTRTPGTALPPVDNDGSLKSKLSSSRDPQKSSYIQSAVDFGSTAVSSSPLLLERRQRDGEWVADERTAFARQLAMPNPDDSIEDLLGCVVPDLMQYGNAYVWRVQMSGGLFLFPVAASNITVKASDNVSPEGNRIVEYIYTAKGAQRTTILPADMTHFRFGRQPRTPYMGKSPIRAIKHELAAATLADSATEKLIENTGHSPLVMVPKNTRRAPQNEAFMTDQRKSAELQDRQSGESFQHLGTVTVLGEEYDVVSVKPTSWKDFGFDDVYRNVEARIASAFGIQPVLLEYRVGLDRSAYNFIQTAERMTYQAFVKPMQNLIARTLEHQLMPQYIAPGALANYRLRFDNSHIAALRRPYEEVLAEANAGIISAEEARMELGYPPGATDAIDTDDEQDEDDI